MPLKLLRERNVAPDSPGVPSVRVDVPKVDKLSPPIVPVQSPDTVIGEVNVEGSHSLLRTKKKYTSKGTWVKGDPALMGRRSAAGRKPKLAMLGIDCTYLDIHDKRYTSALRRAEYYLRRRAKELSIAFGYVSVGVSGILGTAALQLAASKYISQLAAEQAGRDMKLFAELMNLSLKVSNQARQNEVTAWELCAKEQMTVRKINDVAPWLSSSLDTSHEDELVEKLEAKEADNEESKSEEGDEPCETGSSG